MLPIKPGHDHRRIHEDHGRVLRSNSAPEQCPCQVPAYFRMCAWALLAPPSRRRARISPPSNSQAIRLPGNKPAAGRIATGMLVVPLLVKIVSFVFSVRIIPALFSPVYIFVSAWLPSSLSDCYFSPILPSRRGSLKSLLGVYGKPTHTKSPACSRRRARSGGAGDCRRCRRASCAIARSPGRACAWCHSNCSPTRR